MDVLQFHYLYSSVETDLVFDAYRDPRQDPSDNEDDDDDSNDENNWRNEYPDSEPSSIDEEDIIRAMERVDLGKKNNLSAYQLLWWRSCSICDCDITVLEVLEFNSLVGLNDCMIWKYLFQVFYI